MASNTKATTDKHILVTIGGFKKRILKMI